jgi:hypothetical protein
VLQFLDIPLEICKLGQLGGSPVLQRSAYYLFDAMIAGSHDEFYGKGDVTSPSNVTSRLLDLCLMCGALTNHDILGEGVTREDVTMAQQLFVPLLQHLAKLCQNLHAFLRYSVQAQCLTRRPLSK